MPRRLRPLVALLVATILPTVQARQPPAAPPPDRFAAAVAGAAGTAERAVQPALLIYANRPIVTFRATVMSRSPEARAADVTELLQRLVVENPTARTSSRTYPEGTVIRL